MGLDAPGDRLNPGLWPVFAGVESANGEGADREKDRGLGDRPQVGSRHPKLFPDALNHGFRSLD